MAQASVTPPRSGAGRDPTAGIGESAAGSGTIKLGGWLGLATAVAAWYASFAAVNATFGRTVLPVVPMRR